MIDAIPSEIYENPTWKGMVYFFRDLAIYVGLLVLLVFVTNPLLALPIEIVLVLAVTGLFVVAHDSAHGALFNSKRKNVVIGKLAMLPSWHVFEAWVLGHNRIHHAFTVRQGYDFVWHPVTAQEYEEKSRASKVLHRVEWSWMGDGSLLPERSLVAQDDRLQAAGALGEGDSSRPHDRGRVRPRHGAGFGALAYARTHSWWGVAWMILRVEVIPFLGFCVDDRLGGSRAPRPDRHPLVEARRMDQVPRSDGGHDRLTVPKGLNFFFHWIMIHTPHHVDMRIPMYNLEKAAKAIEKAFPDVVHDEPWRFGDFRGPPRRASSTTSKLVTG